MIEYLQGGLAELSPATAVIDCNGVGYLANISLNTYASIQGKKTCKLYIYEAIREDAYVLYGFADKQERELFLQLITVSGIGGNTARMILSALSPAELVQAADGYMAGRVSYASLRALHGGFSYDSGLPWQTTCAAKNAPGVTK